MTAAKLFAVLVTLLLVAPFAGLALGLDGEFSISDVEYNDPVAPGSSVDVTIELSNTDGDLDVVEVEVKAWIEDSFGDRISNKAAADIGKVRDSNEKREVTLTLNMPEDAEEDEYKLMVKATGFWQDIGDKADAEFVGLIDVEQVDDSLFVKEIRLTKNIYKAADTVDVAVTVVNTGVDDQDDVSVAVAVPDFGISKAITLFGTFFSGTEQTIYFTFELPEDVEGIHTLRASASNSLASSTLSKNLIIEMPPTVDADDSISSTSVTKNLQVGKTTEIPVKVSNNGAEVKDYSVVVDSELDTVVSPTEFSLSPGQSQVVTVKVFADKAGEYDVNIVVLEGDEAVSAVKVNANVTEGMSEAAGLFLVLILLLAGVAVWLQYKKSDKALYF